MPKTKKKGGGKLSNFLRKLKRKKTKSRKSSRHNTSPRTPRKKRILQLFGTDIKTTPTKQSTPTPKSIPTPGTQVTPDLLRLVDQTSPTTSARKPSPQNNPPVNLSPNPKEVMPSNRMGPPLPLVRCLGKSTEEECNEDGYCKWDSTEKKCREKPPILANFSKPNNN